MVCCADLSESGRSITNQTFSFFLFSGYYSTGAFFLAKSVIEVPPVLITNALFVAIVNIYDSVLGWKESSGSSGLFWPLWRLLTLSQMGSLGMGACFAMAGGKNGHRSLTAPVIVLCGTCLTLMVVSNNLVPIGEMHYVYQLLSWFSIPRFTYETVSLLVFGFGRCKRGEEVSAMLYTLSLSDEDEGDYYRNLGILLCNVLFYRSLALYLLIRKVGGSKNQKRTFRVLQHQKSMENSCTKSFGFQAKE